jgi:hypothetical protein
VSVLITPATVGAQKTRNTFEVSTEGWPGTSGAVTVARDATVSKNGSASLKVTITGINGIVGSPAGLNGYPVFGTKAVLGFWIQADATTAGRPFFVQPYARDGSGGWYQNLAQFNFTMPAAGAWKYIASSQTIAGGTVYIDFYLYADSTLTSGSFWLDDVTVRPLPIVPLPTIPIFPATVAPPVVTIPAVAPGPGRPSVVAVASVPAPTVSTATHAYIDLRTNGPVESISYSG